MLFNVFYFLIKNAFFILGSTFFIYIYDHHQLLTPATWWRWVRINALLCCRSFVKSLASLGVNPSDLINSFMLSIKRSLSLDFSLLPLNMACTLHCAGFGQYVYTHRCIKDKQRIENMPFPIGCMV